MRIKLPGRLRYDDLGPPRLIERVPEHFQRADGSFLTGSEIRRAAMGVTPAMENQATFKMRDTP